MAQRHDDRKRASRVHPVSPPAYIYVDPVRLLCVGCALGLMLMAKVPDWLVALTIGASQFQGIAMLVRGLGFTAATQRTALGQCRTVQYLGMESFTLSSCTLLGGLLLMRLFGSSESVLALGLLTIAVAMVPDIHVCRWSLPGDPLRASRALDEGTFLRDPVKLGALLSAAIFWMLDSASGLFVFLSMVVLQFNAIAVMLDKYLTPALKSADGSRATWRVALSLLPLGLVPLNVFVGRDACDYAAAALAALIVVPDVPRLLAEVPTMLRNLARLPRLRLAQV